MASPLKQLGLTAWLTAAFSAPALAVTTAHWTQTSEADFAAGKTDNAVVTNLGDVKLSRALKMILEQDPLVSAVYAMIEAPDGTIYAATGPRGVLLKITGEKVETAATLPGAANLTALAFDANGRLVIGSAGETGTIFRIDKPGAAPEKMFSVAGVQYIWAITVTPDGMIYAATGPEGQLFEIKPDGTHRVVADTDERNLLSMASDGGDMLYVGADPDGLLYRINRKTGQTFVLYDAAESEISAIAVDAKGSVYAATGQAQALAGGGATQATAEQIGRPESESPTPLPANPPKDPTPPPTPDPNPGEPAPNRKSQVPRPKSPPNLPPRSALAANLPRQKPSPRPAPYPPPRSALAPHHPRPDRTPTKWRPTGMATSGRPSPR